MTTTNQADVEMIKTLLGSNNVTVGDFQPGKVAIWDYSQPAHFNALWNVFNKKVLSVVERVLIIWDNTPEDSALHPINPTKHVSALHWAMCASEKTGLGLRIAILDKNPAAHKDSRLYNQFSCCDKGMFDWLKVLQAADLFTFPGAGESSPSKETIAARFFSEKVKDRQQRNASFFLQAIKEEITSPIDPSDRHAIANVIGPMLLLQTKPSIERVAEAADQGEALKHLLTVCKLIEPSNDVGSPYLGIENIHHGRDIRIILVDDQAKHGWLQWLTGCVRRFMPEAKVVSLTVNDLSVRLVDAVNGLSGDARDKRFSLRLFGDPQDQTEEILCLDLRLFSGGERKEESDFYTRIFGLWRTLKERARTTKPTRNVGIEGLEPGLAWPDNISTEEATIQRWCESDGNEAGHQATLTLLPRLIAQLDMAYPIILFSSTGQGVMFKRLQDYGNVILDFEKPRFFDPQDASLVRRQTIFRLQNSFSKSLALLEARRKCARLEAHATAWKDATQKRRFPLTNSRYHVELYMDETGFGQGLKLGGLFAIFENPETPMVLADAFDDTLVEHGVRYFDSFGIGAQPSSGRIKSKAETCATEFNSAVTKWSDQGYAVHLGFVQIGGINPFPEANDIFARTDFGDNRWRFALEALLELFLHETLPAIFGPRMEGHVSISIFAPTRVLACDEQEAKDYERRFGWSILRKPDGEFVRNEHNGLLLRVFSPNDLYDVLSAIPKRQMADYDLQRALAVKLVYKANRAGRPAIPEYWISGESFVRTSASGFIGENNLKTELKRVSPALSDWRPDLRSLHYVCDQYLRDRQGFDSISKSSLNGQFREVLDADLASALNCRRAFAEERLAEAVSDVPLLGDKLRQGIGMIAADIGEGLGRLKGLDFCNVAARLSSSSTQILPPLESSFPKDTTPSETGATAKLDSASKPETKDPILIQSTEPIDISDKSSALFRTRYCVRFPELPNDFTETRLENLVRTLTEQDASTFVVPSSLDKRCGFVWFKSETAAELVFLRTRRAWGTEIHISPPFSESVTGGIQEVDSMQEPQGRNKDDNMGEVATAPEPPPTRVTIRIAGIPAELKQCDLKDRLRRFGLTQLDLHQHRPTRGSTKYEAEFVLSRNEAERFIDECKGAIRLGDTECSAVFVDGYN